MAPLRFADVSSHNTITSWSAFLGSLDGLIVKVSEGTGYAWAGAPNALARARSAGKLVGVYHFARVGDPVAEADYFLANYSHQSGEVIVLDWEPGTTVGDGDAWAFAWCSRVIARTGVVPWLYLNRYYATQQSQWTRTRSLGCGLWAAWYGANTGQPLPGMPGFAPWTATTAWQYTSNGSAPGHSGALDLNYFYGTPDQWRAFGNGTAQEADLTPDEHNMLTQVWSVIGHAYTRDGDDLGTKITALATDLAPIERYGPDGKTIVKTSIRQELANLSTAVAAGPQAVADAVVQAVQALPVAEAAQVADLVIAGLGQRINTPPAAS